MRMDYLKNIQLALTLGFEEVPDKNAYEGKYYIKEGKIWIHDIDALKSKLGKCTDSELKYLNYDVESYFKYINHTNEMVDKEIEEIKAAIISSDSALAGQYHLLYNKELLKSMSKLAEEGFDEEILADFAHQMSKY